jgi:hypothetical protein
LITQLEELNHSFFTSFLSCDIPAAVANYPSMMTPREKGLLYWLAKEVYSGEGIIVDAGIFLGASTYAFASGFKENNIINNSARIYEKPISSYDIAIWVGSMDRYKDSPAFKELFKNINISAGDSFEIILQGLLSDHLDVVDLRIGDIIQLAETKDPVEIAFYDCLKNSERDVAAFKAFCPKFIPGKTIVVQQDYFYQSAPHHRIRQEFLSPFFTYLGHIRDTAVFRLERAVPKAYFTNDPVESLSLAEKLALIEQAAARVSSPRFVLLTLLSAVEFLIEVGELEMARERVFELEEQANQLSGEEPDFHLDYAIRMISSMKKSIEAKFN